MASLRTQTVLCGVVASCGGADNEMPQLHATVLALTLYDNKLL